MKKVSLYPPHWVTATLAIIVIFTAMYVLRVDKSAFVQHATISKRRLAVRTFTSAGGFDESMVRAASCDSHSFRNRDFGDGLAPLVRKPRLALAKHG
jgi:hypothetical protein